MAGLGAAHAATPILKRRRWDLNDVDYWEINENFSSQVLACLEAWQDKDYCREQLAKRDAVGELEMGRLNIEGGAIALGDPTAASGARLILHLLHILQNSRQNEASRPWPSAAARAEPCCWNDRNG
ncbi:hypothetical protein [Alkalilimnicola ehrlichii]|uniref:hypothetical protein n=1 Tax=Alkalilimnicola ehrlichii TaxID=351052 RepID=UPI0021626681|nr:hypothetical protein [Alkalilimnicola ehrlichii]